MVIKSDNGDTTRYRFNKDFDSWVPLSKKITVIKKDNALLSKVITEPLSKKIHTKETLTKETNTKEGYTPSDIAKKLHEIFLDTMSDEFKEKHKNEPGWLKCYDKLLKEYDKEKLARIIIHYRNDTFWIKNFMSPLKLIRKNKDGIRYIDYFIECLKPQENGEW